MCVYIIGMQKLPNLQIAPKTVNFRPNVWWKPNEKLPLSKTNFLEHAPADSSGSEAVWSGLKLKELNLKSKAMYTLGLAFDHSKELQNAWDLVKTIFIYERAFHKIFSQFEFE